MRTHVPAFPAATAIVRADGSAEVTINGVSRPILAADVAHARREATAVIVALAGKVHRPVRLTTHEDTASYRLAVHPSGLVSSLDADGYTEVPEHPIDGLPQLNAPSNPANTVIPPLVGDVPRAWYAVTFSTGERVELEQPTIVGRLPRLSSEEEVAAVQLHDTTMTVSKRHARLQPTEHGILVTDLGSANGTRIRNPNGQMATVPPGTPHLITIGDVIELGDTVTATVTEVLR